MLPVPDEVVSIGIETLAGKERRRVIPPIRRWDLRGFAFRRASWAAVRMLPPDVQAAIAAALRQDADTRQAFEPAATPPYLFAVRYDRPGVFKSLRHLAWARPDLLGVVFDRRWMGERRNRHEPGHGERRCGERRCSVPEPTWTTMGFLLVEATESATLQCPPPAVSTSPSSRPAEVARRPTAVKQTASVDRMRAVGPVRLARAISVWPWSRRQVVVGALCTLLLLLATSVVELHVQSRGRPLTLTGSTPPRGAALVRQPASAVTAVPGPPAPASTAPEPRVASPPDPSGPRQERAPVAVKAPAVAEPTRDDEAVRATVSLERAAIPRPSPATSAEGTAVLPPTPPSRRDDARLPPQVLPAPPRTGPATATSEPDPSDIIDWLVKEGPRSSD
jgi:hypothetical protein